MSAFDPGDRKTRIDVSRYAPPQYRAPAGGGTDSPVRERLSRGRPQDQSDAISGSPQPEPLHVQPASPRIPLSMTGRLAVAVGLVAGLAVVSVTFLQSKADHSAAAAAARKAASKVAVKDLDAPKTVHTVSLTPETVGEAQTADAQASNAQASNAQTSNAVERPAPSTDGFGGSAAGLVPTGAPVAATARPLTAPLAMWAMFPAAPTQAQAQTQADDAKDVKQTKDAAPPRAAKRTRHARRHKRHAARHRVRRRRTRAAAAKPQPTQQRASASQPVKKMPIQAALDKLFGNSGDSASGSAAPAPAPETTGAAFR